MEKRAKTIDASDQQEMSRDKPDTYKRYAMLPALHCSALLFLLCSAIYSALFSALLYCMPCPLLCFMNKREQGIEQLPLPKISICCMLLQLIVGTCFTILRQKFGQKPNSSAMSD